MNTESIRDILTKLKSDKKTMAILIVAIVGMLLIMLSETGERDSKANEADNSSEYILSENELCEELENLIENINGAGKAKVMITFEASAETVYAADVQEKTTKDGEENITREYIIIDSSGGETGMKLKIISPEVKGVAVVCRGAKNPVIKEQIISAVSALFDISSNKISVAEMA